MKRKNIEFNHKEPEFRSEDVSALREKYPTPDKLDFNLYYEHLPVNLEDGSVLGDPTLFSETIHNDEDLALADKNGVLVECLDVALKQVYYNPDSLPDASPSEDSISDIPVEPELIRFREELVSLVNLRIDAINALKYRFF